MAKDPWTDPDPQPGDFYAELAPVDRALVARHDGDPRATLRLVVSVVGEDARRLARLAEARGKRPGDIVAELLRDADRPPA
jgi:hypothetical protein